MRVFEQVWGTAIKRAVSLGIQPELVERKLTSHGSVARHYEVASATEPGVRYNVLIEVNQEGEISAFCLCKAGLGNIPCKHAAAALLAAGYLRPPVTAETRARGRAALALLNDDMDTYEELTRSA